MSYRKYLMPSDISPSEAFKATEVPNTPLAQHEQRMDLLKAEIKRMKRSFTICKNSDYYTGYMSALSAIEGYIAKLEGDAE